MYIGCEKHSWALGLSEKRCIGNTTRLAIGPSTMKYSVRCSSHRWLSCYSMISEKVLSQLVGGKGRVHSWIAWRGTLSRWKLVNTCSFRSCFPASIPANNNRGKLDCSYLYNYIHKFRTSYWRRRENEKNWRNWEQHGLMPRSAPKAILKWWPNGKRFGKVRSFLVDHKLSNQNPNSPGNARAIFLQEIRSPAHRLNLCGGRRILHMLHVR